MIALVTDIIVGASLVAALWFLVAWSMRPDLRRRVEGPKHRFLEGVKRYDRQCRDQQTDGIP